MKILNRKISLCNRYKNRDWTKIIFSDLWTFYLESPSELRKVKKRFLKYKKKIIKSLIDV